MREIAEHLLEFAATAWGPVVLVTHAYFEGFILPVAHELFLIAVSIAKPKMSFVYALMSTTASTLGILTGYAIGRFGGHPILAKIFPKKLLDKAEETIHKYDFWAIAVACFTPVPVKVFALFAGALELDVKKLAVVAFLFRGARFFLVSALLFFYGEQAKEWILKYLDQFFIVILTLCVIGFIALRWMHHKEKKEASN